MDPRGRTRGGVFPKVKTEQLSLQSATTAMCEPRRDDGDRQRALGRSSWRAGIALALLNPPAVVRTRLVHGQAGLGFATPPQR